MAQLLGVHGDGSNRQSFAVPAQFKGMQCAVSSTSAAIADDVAGLGVHQMSILRGECTGACAPMLSTAGQRTSEAPRDCTLPLAPVADVSERLQHILRLRPPPRPGAAPPLLRGGSGMDLLPDVDAVVLHIRACDVCSSVVDPLRAGALWPECLPPS